MADFLGTSVAYYVQKHSGQMLQTETGMCVFDAHFPPAGDKSLLQKVFQVPHRPQHVMDLPSLLEWIRCEQQRSPELACVRGGGTPEILLQPLCNAVDRFGGDLIELDKAVHEAISTLRECFACSDLCQSLMCGRELWSLGKLSEVFNKSQVKKQPPNLCGYSRYASGKWISEYDGCAFLSIDMREANLSSLRLMARLVDPMLFAKICTGWVPLLESLLGNNAQLVTASKPVREIVLGGLERHWLRCQPDLRGIEGVDVALASLEGAAFMRCAFGDEEISDVDSAACRRIFKVLQGRISKAFTAVEHAMIERVAQSVGSACGLQPFATVGDEAVFLLETRSVEKANRAALEAFEAVRSSFHDEYVDLAKAFRIEAFLAHDMGQAFAGKSSRGIVTTTRRLLPSGGWETFQTVKGFKASSEEQAVTLSQGLCALRGTHGSEWAQWMECA